MHVAVGELNQRCRLLSRRRSEIRQRAVLVSRCGIATSLVERLSTPQVLGVGDGGKRCRFGNFLQIGSGVVGRVIGRIVVVNASQGLGSGAALAVLHVGFAEKIFGFGARRRAVRFQQADGFTRPIGREQRSRVCNQGVMRIKRVGKASAEVAQVRK